MTHGGAQPIPSRPWRFHRRAWSLMAAWGLWGLLTGCQVLSVNNAPYADLSPPHPEPPRTIAILPTTDRSGNPELAPLMRQALFRAASELPYEDVETAVVDARLGVLAAHLDQLPDALAAQTRAHPSVADLVLFSEIDKVNRFYLFLYAHIKIDMRIALVDTRNRHILYRDELTIHDRLGAPTVSIPGLIENMTLSLLHLRPASIQRTLEKSANRIITDLPMPQTDRASGSGLRLREVRVQVPGPLLSTGDAVTVEAQGTAGADVSMAIGRLLAHTPMQEIAPGEYQGAYTIRKGDDTPYSIVEVRLKSKTGDEQVSYAAAETAFAVDTIPPRAARINEWWPDEDARQGIYLAMTIDPPRWRMKPDPPVRYHVYRRPAETGDAPQPFVWIGSVATSPFHDASAERGRRYEYHLVSEDAAGNLSAPGQTMLVDFQAKP